MLYRSALPDDGPDLDVINTRSLLRALKVRGQIKFPAIGEKAVIINSHTGSLLCLEAYWELQSLF